MLGLNRHITPFKVPSFKQQKIAFRKAPLKQPPFALILEVVLEEEDNGAKELLIDALIGKACGDDDILEEPITIQAVFNSVQRLLSH